MRRLHTLRKLESWEIHCSLCDIAEEFEIKCFSIIYENGYFTENNIEKMSDELLRFDLTWPKEEDNEISKEQAKETANCYYFLLLKLIQEKIMIDDDYVLLHHTYPYLIDPKIG